MVSWHEKLGKKIQKGSGSTSAPPHAVFIIVTIKKHHTDMLTRLKTWLSVGSASDLLIF